MTAPHPHVCRYVPPDEHNARRCADCKTFPWCPDCYGHHGPLDDPHPYVNGPRPTRVVVVLGEGVRLLTGWPDGAPVGEDEREALGHAKANPGVVVAVEKRGTWFAKNRWERFLTAGPFRADGSPVPQKDDGLEKRQQFLAERQRQAEERERLAAAGKPVADARRKNRRGRR